VVGLLDGELTDVLFVRDVPTAGLRLAVGRLDNDVRDSAMVVLDEAVSGRRLGTIDLISPFELSLADGVRIVVCGIDERAREVSVEWSDARTEHIVPIHGVWMTTIRSFVPGLAVTVHWDHGDGRLRFGGGGPWHRSDLAPHLPGWTSYAPGSAPR
jgi:hypothetical protein